MNHQALMRRYLLEDIFSRMTDEEKRLYIQMSIQDRDHQEIMRALHQIDKKADSNHHSWLSDFSANVAGNYFADASIWLVSRLLKIK